jgi:hypothetical protein
MADITEDLGIMSYMKFSKLVTEIYEVPKSAFRGELLAVL